MKTTPPSCAMLALLMWLFPLASGGQTFTVNTQVFKVDTLYPTSGTTGLNALWEITSGPDYSLWVTEAKGYKVWKINTRNKGGRTVLDVSADKNFSEASTY